MFGFFRNLMREPLSIENLQLLQMITQQVVLSVENSVRISGTEKKALALKLTGAILKKADIVAPDSVVDTAIEASVQMMKHLGKENKSNSLPGFRVDISGRPHTSGGM